MSLAWLLAKAPDVVPIPGTRRTAYLEQNARAAEVVLSEADVARLDAVTVTGARETVLGGNWTDGATPARRTNSAPS